VSRRKRALGVEEKRQKKRRKPPVCRALKNRRCGGAILARALLYIKSECAFPSETERRMKNK